VDHPWPRGRADALVPDCTRSRRAS
jgi:hypothetical protein